MQDDGEEVGGAGEAALAADLMHAVGRVSVRLAVEGRAQADAVELVARVGAAEADARAAQRRVGVGDVGVEGGVEVAVGAEEVVGADFAGVRRRRAAGQEVAKGDALFEAVGVRGRQGVGAVDLDAAGDLILHAEAVGVDGAVLGGALGGAADVRWLRDRRVAGGGRRDWVHGGRGRNDSGG